MRKFQLTLRMDALLDDGSLRTFSVYSDANNIWEAVCAGVEELISTTRSETGIALPEFGCVESYTGPKEW